MVDAATRGRLREIYQNLEYRPLKPGDPLYVPMFEDPDLSPYDPVARMLTKIEFAGVESSQLFSGDRGAGKSTQLERLKHELEQDPRYKVVLCDMEDYLSPSDPVEVVDFLLAAAGALSEELAAPELLGPDGVTAFASRFVGWMKEQGLEVEGLGLSIKGGVVGGDLKLKLKNDESFRTRVRERTRLHLGALQRDAHAFFFESWDRLRARYGPETELVILFDSIEHIRGTTSNAKDVASSVERLFRAHAEALQIPWVHTVYSVPAWLRAHTAAIEDTYDGYAHIPCVKLHEQRRETLSQEGLALLRRIADKRVPGGVTWLLGDDDTFQQLALNSGGYLRDLFRLLRFLVIDATQRGLPATRVELAIQDLRNAYVSSFTNSESVWLQRIADTGEISPDDRDELEVLAGFLSTHLVLSYQNGALWFDVHPVIRDDVKQRAAAFQARQNPKPPPADA